MLEVEHRNEGPICEWCGQRSYRFKDDEEWDEVKKTTIPEVDNEHDRLMQGRQLHENCIDDICETDIAEVQARFN